MADDATALDASEGGDSVADAVTALDASEGGDRVADDATALDALVAVAPTA